MAAKRKINYNSTDYKIGYNNGKKFMESKMAKEVNMDIQRYKKAIENKSLSIEILKKQKKDAVKVWRFIGITMIILFAISAVGLLLIGK